MDIFQLLRDRLHAKAGISERRTDLDARAKFKKMEETEWSPEFEQLMRNRLLMGCLRYGPLLAKKKVGHKWDLMGAVEKKIKLWKATGNDEYLVDIANYCLLEFACGAHVTKHFHALDDHHDHCQLKSA